jgi:hypothetical protein
MEKLHLAVRQLVPGLRLAIRQKSALSQRIEALKDDEGPVNLADRPVAEQAAFIQASDIVHLCGCYIGGALTNLAHSEEAFALIAPELDPSIAQHARDSVVDDLACAPFYGVSAEAVIVASLSSVEGDLNLAQSQLSRASSLLDTN